MEEEAEKMVKDSMVLMGFEEGSVLSQNLTPIDRRQGKDVVKVEKWRF
jgi:hypothetical protein